MEQFAALLLIVGCSDGVASCKPMPAPQPVFATMQQCSDKLQPTISLFTTKVPQVVGKCVAIAPSVDVQRSSLVWAIDRDGQLIADVRPDDAVMTASAEARRPTSLRG